LDEGISSVVVQEPFKLVLSVFLAAVSTSILTAQTFRGTLLGTVADPTGAVISGASISVKNDRPDIQLLSGLNSVIAAARFAVFDPRSF